MPSHTIDEISEIAGERLTNNLYRLFVDENHIIEWFYRPLGKYYDGKSPSELLEEGGEKCKELEDSIDALVSGSYWVTRSEIKKDNKCD
ncbi:MAG: hypothetical protein U9Q69_00905 [Nanoarchaeota archaeon]|nr:hypothetical protein [Nanoarchaeota archaeon]